MSPVVLVMLGLSTVGCKAKLDETCERAVDIATKCDAIKHVGHEVGLDAEARDYQIGICKRALSDEPEASDVDEKIRQEVRAYALCKANANGCEEYQRCEALLHLPAKPRPIGSSARPGS